MRTDRLIGAVVALALVQASGAQAPLMAKEEQVTAAVLPLPAAQRAGARVLGYETRGKLGVLREGKGMVCLAPDPDRAEFHVACYHESMEAFMARGRELRAGGTVGTQVDTVRFREVKAGTLKMPAGPAALYSLTGGTFDSKANAAPGARHLYVVYVPFATGASTGLPERPVGTQPWIMFPGTPKAHIMFTPGM